LPERHHVECSVDALLEGQQPPYRAFSPQAALAMLEPPIHPGMLGRIDEYDIEEKIGHGGMGVVFRGFDRSLNRPVAIKVMAPHLGANGVARKRFAREAKAAAAVVHPSVVPIYRVNSNEERPYIAMAFVDGHSLQDCVSSDGPLETREIVRISMQVADGLAAAHRQGLVHRDVKPANILMEKDVNRVMITDFGLARAIDDVAMTQSGCLAGTPNYMSPEQVTGGDVDERSDLFSLGSVMYFLATGREPFRSESAYAVINKVTREDAVPVRNINAEIPEPLGRIIGRLLERNPADRFQSADELQQLLTKYLAHLQNPQTHSHPQVKATPSELRRIRNRLALGVAAVGLLLTLAWGSLFVFGNPFETNGTNVHEQRGGSDHGEKEHHEEGEEHGHTDSHQK
jgi:serine/threonine-protein kinase